MPDDMSYDRLLERYFCICNEAMKAHGQEFPYSVMFGAMADKLKTCPVSVAVYDDLPKAAGSVTLAGDELEVRPFVEEKSGRVARVPLSELMNVVQDPERYISDPTLIDWTWAGKQES